MIVGCYSLDLYCDSGREHPYGMPGSPGVPAKYTGETGEECRRKARKRGWKLDVRQDTALCPDCAQLGLKPKPDDDP